MPPRYVFVVGLPRTGTKLVRNVLESSPRVDCKLSAETFYMGHFIRKGLRHRLRALGDMKDDASVRRLADYLYSGKAHGTYWEYAVKGKLGVDKESFTRALLASDRSERDIYRVILEVHTDVTERTVLGDKTPGNLYHVPALLEWFPDAKIVHTFRDPRAVLASEWKRRMTSRPPGLLSRLTSPLASLGIVIHTTVTWLHAVKLHHRYLKRYPKSYYLSKFEDLVSRPAEHSRKLCEFLEIEFDEEMLNPRHVGSSFDRTGGSGFDTATLYRWREHLKPWMKAWMEVWAGRRLREFGYERDAPAQAPAERTTRTEA